MNRTQNLVEDQVRSLTTDIGFIDTQKQDVVRLRGNADFERSPEIRKILLEAAESTSRSPMLLPEWLGLRSDELPTLVTSWATIR